MRSYAVVTAKKSRQLYLPCMRRLYGGFRGFPVHERISLLLYSPFFRAASLPRRLETEPVFSTALLFSTCRFVVAYGMVKVLCRPSLPFGAGVDLW